MNLLARLEDILPDNIRRIRLPGLRGTLAIVAAVWAVSLTPLLTPWDDLLYDALVRLLPGKNTALHEVVLVETPPETQAVPPELVHALLDGGARHVVLLQPMGDTPVLTGATPERLTRARPLPRDLPPEGGPRLAPNEVPATLPDSRSGMFRQQWSRTTVGGEARLTLEGQVARQLGRSDLPETFQVNFHQGRHLPRIPAAKANNVDALSPVVRGKVVLVGPGGGPFAAELAVPGEAEQSLVTRTEFHALALDTLLQEREVLQAGPWLKLLLLALLGATLLMVLQPLQLRHGMLAAGALGTGFFVLAAVLLRTADLWLPAQAVVIVMAGVFVVVYRDKAKYDAQQISALLASMEAKLHHRLLPERFSESQEHWNHVVNLVDQTLQLHRSIFLDRVTSDHRVKEIAAMNCSLDAIDEMRRDYERPPYTLAIQARGAIVLPATRQFLRTVEADEVQCLAPFILEGEVLGFWAFGVSARTLEHTPGFLESVNRMAEQIAALLYQRKLWQDEQEREAVGLSRFVRDDATTRLNSLQQAIAALDRRTRGLESVFSGITTAAVLYDLFGRVVLINPRMSELLAGNSLPPYETTANDLIAALTGMPPEDVRRLLDRMVRNEETAQFQVTLQKPAAADFLLNVRPLAAHRQHGAGTPDEEDDSHPFDLHGILFELVDIQELNRGFALKLELMDFVTHGITEEFSRLKTVQAEDCFSPPQQAPRCDFAGELNGRVAQLGNRLEELRRLLSHPVGVGHTNVYPLAPDALVAQATERLAPASTRKQLNWAVAPLACRALCHANPVELRQLIESCCERLIGDAISASAITIAFDVTPAAITIRLSNAGFGMPPERLQELLATAPPQVPQAEWQMLRKAIASSRDWGAEFTARAALGQGLEFAIQLPRFH